MLRQILCVLLLLLAALPASAAGPNAEMELILNDESKPPGERSVAIIFTFDRMPTPSAFDPVLHQLSADAAAYAEALKAHGGYDTVVLVKNENINRNNVMGVVRSFTELPTPPKYLMLHWAGPALDDLTLLTPGYNPDHEFGEGAPVFLDHLNLVLYGMGTAHVVVSFDAPPGPPEFADPSASKFNAGAWSQPNSAALSAGPGCADFTRQLTLAVNEAKGRRLSIKDLVAAVTRTCGSPPMVHMPVGRNEDGSATIRLPDSATFIALGDTRGPITETMPAPMPQPLAPVPVVPTPDLVPVVTRDRKIPRGVGFALTGTGVVLAGATTFEMLRYTAALEARKTTLDTEEYTQSTKRANAAATGAGVLGTLAVSCLAVGLVITF